MGKRITINDIARISNTSKTTVSFYLNGKYDKMSEETRNRIKKAIEDHHYVPNMAARSLNKKKTLMIGVIVGKITTEFSNKLVNGIEDTAFEHNYQVMMASSYFMEEREYQLALNMIRGNVDGFIIQPSQNFSRTLELLRKYNKKVVFVDSHLKDEGIDCIKTNNKNATETMTKKLYDLGYNQFAIIHGDPQKITTRNERYQGFLAAMGKDTTFYELRVSEDLYEINETEIRDLIRQLLQSGKRNAVFVSNCWLLPKIYQVATDQEFRNKIPKNLILYGFDNEEWIEYIHPRIPSMIQPAYEEGQLSFTTLYKKLKEENDEEIGLEKVLQCKFINMDENFLKD